MTDTATATSGSSTTPDSVTMRIWRGEGEGGSFEDYTLPAQEGEVVLDVVHRVQAELAPDLAVRWNCKAGKCGSCSAEINGKPRLMCMTRMSTLPADEPITVSPMRGFPLIRDLVTDVSFNYAVARRLPGFRPGPREADGTYRMAQVDIDRSQEFRKCIECFLCQNVCHVIRDHEENKANFAGPRFIMRLAELEMHPLDTLDRRRFSFEEFGLGYCNITKCCTEVCPESIHITDNAIIPLKERAVDSSYDPIAWLGRKVFRRPAPASAESVAALAPERRSGEVIVASRDERLLTARSVADFLTAAWFEELADRLHALGPIGDSSSQLALGQVVTDAPDGTLSWTVLIGGGVATEVVTGIERADVVLIEDFDTALELLSGVPSTELLNSGNVKIRGSVAALLEGAELLALVSEAMQSINGPDPE